MGGGEPRNLNLLLNFSRSSAAEMGSELRACGAASSGSRAWASARKSRTVKPAASAVHWAHRANKGLVPGCSRVGSTHPPRPGAQRTRAPALELLLWGPRTRERTTAKSKMLRPQRTSPPLGPQTRRMTPAGAAARRRGKHKATGSPAAVPPAGTAAGATGRPRGAEPNRARGRRGSGAGLGPAGRPPPPHVKGRTQKDAAACGPRPAPKPGLLRVRRT